MYLCTAPKRKDVGTGRAVKLQREQALSRVFNHAYYISHRPSQLRGDLRIVHRRKEMINRVVRGSVGSNLLSISYQEESARRNLNIA